MTWRWLFLVLLGSCWSGGKVKNTLPPTPHTPPHLRVAIISNDFCQLSRYQKYPQVHLNYVSISGDPLQNCQVLPEYSDQLRGHFLLQRFLMETDLPYAMEIFLFDLIRQDGSTDEELWQIAFDHMFKNQINVLILSVGIAQKDKKNKVIKFPPHLFVLLNGQEADRPSPLLHWPHLYAPADRSLTMSTITDPMPAPLYPQTLYYYFHPHKKLKKLPSSVRSLAVGAARVLNHCPQEILKDHSKLKPCLERKATLIDKQYPHLEFY